MRHWIRHFLNFWLHIYPSWSNSRKLVAVRNTYLLPLILLEFSVFLECFWHFEHKLLVSILILKVVVIFRENKFMKYFFVFLRKYYIVLILVLLNRKLQILYLAKILNFIMAPFASTEFYVVGELLLNHNIIVLILKSRHFFRISHSCMVFDSLKIYLY